MNTPLAPDARILLRVPSWLGDLVMAEPVVRGFDERWRAVGREGCLSLAGPARLLALFEGRFEGVLRVESGPASAWRGHDVAVLLTGSFRSAWTAVRAGIPRRAGYARDLRSLLLTDSLCPAREAGGVPFGLGREGRPPRHLPRPFGASCIELASLLGVIVRDTRPRLEVSQAARERVEERLKAFGIERGEPFLLANAGARPGSAKGFPHASWARVIEELERRTRLATVLVCGPGEEEALIEVRRLAPDVRARVWIEPVASLAELVELCALSRLFLTADSGPRHIANAVGTPVVVAAGPTDPRHTADHLATTRLLRVTVPCGPCHLERCPLHGDAHHACMRGIDPTELVDAAEELLRYHAPRSSPGLPEQGLP